MDKDFADIIQRMVNEQGKEVLVNGRAKTYLSDYCKGQFKKEAVIFRQILEANCGESINNADNVSECKQKLVEKLEEDNGLSPKATSEYLNLLGLILKGDVSKTGINKQIPPSSRDTAWYVLVNGAKKGPLDRTDLNAMFVAGEITQKSYVWKKGMADWVEAETIQELEESIADLPPPLPQKLTAVFSTGTQTAANPQSAVSADMVRIQDGTFKMGSPANELSRGSDEVQHQVTVSGFYMGRYEVTQKEYKEVMGTNPSKFKMDDLPVERVNWYDAVEYCNKRSQMEGLTPAYTRNGDNVTWNRGASGYRLPTEAEWEYACRAGTTTPFSTGNNITTSQANYNGKYPYNNNAKGENRKKTTAVGSLLPNAWGLYDMHGNVWEWCWDWYGDYTNRSQTDQIGVVIGTHRVLRGGGWSSCGLDLRSACRDYFYPNYRNYNIGFRLVRF
ncbi:SUMF1/EgtB/PvdO family nonheme iron enzyme [Treponema sp. R80B11-R83G3]